MELKTMKSLALSSAVALAIATHGPAYAQTESMTATIITSSAITSNFVSDLDFGTWLIQFVDGTPAITLTDDGSVAATQTGTIANSQVVQITAPATEGELNVQTPAPATLTMTASNFVDLADAGLSLTTVTYNTANESGNVIASAAAVANGVTVTTLAGATDEDVVLGGVIAITATPADQTHSATFDLTFTY